MESVYDAAGGKDGLIRLAEAWHARVMADEVVSHAFSHGFHPEHTERLAAYWGEALGGPSEYTRNFGDESEVVRMHACNGPHEEMDRRALACFDLAMGDVGIDNDNPVRRALHAYFAWKNNSVAKYSDPDSEVPVGLELTRWSWNGPST